MELLSVLEKEKFEEISTETSPLTELAVGLL